jgi:hypothetical protein
MITYSRITQLSLPAIAMIDSRQLEEHAANARLHHSVASAMGAADEADIATRTEGRISLVLSKRNRRIEQEGA